MVEDNFPRILVISHTSFTKSDSMGSTMASYFTEETSHCLAQFYIKDMKPDIAVCDNYYCVTDREVLKKLLNVFVPSIGRSYYLPEMTVEKSGNLSAQSDTLGKQSHRDATMLIRKLLWSTNIWKNKAFKKWLNNFNPQMVLVQPGDFSFILDLAVYISKKRNIPLIVHQSESYYMKEYESNSLIYRLFRYDFKKSFERMMKQASHCIYLCDALKDDYGKFFNTPSSVIMKPTDIIPEHTKRIFDKKNLRFLFGGNLSEKVGRHIPLLEIGQALKELGYVLDVYTASKGDHLKDLTEENGVRLHGPISKDELVSLMKDSDFVINVENQSPEHIKDLKYAFSTKIADMLACGCCSIAYGSVQQADIRYFKDNALGCCIENKEELVSKIKQVIDDNDLREKYIENALLQAKKGHSPSVNPKETNSIIQKIMKDGKL